jgi:hypothetical protein
MKINYEMYQQKKSISNQIGILKFYTYLYIEFDGFDYYSSQDPFEFEYQIEEFEFRQCWKSKNKVRKYSFSISSKTVQSKSISIKL